MLNVGSNGYANKLKYLFLTGSVVIWVKKDSLNYEFFEHQFVPGIHYVQVDTVEEVPAAIRTLQGDPAYAKAIATAGYERMSQMDVEEVSHYCFQMMKAYAALQRFKPKRDPRSWEVNCEDDMVRDAESRTYADTYAHVPWCVAAYLPWHAVHVSTCMLQVRHYDRGVELQKRYIVQDNSSCLRPPAESTLVAPGWGGAYAGTHPPCLSSHDLSAKEEVGVCTPGTPQFSYSGVHDGPDWDFPEAYKGGALARHSGPGRRS